MAAPPPVFVAVVVVAASTATVKGSTCWHGPTVAISDRSSPSSDSGSSTAAAVVVVIIILALVGTTDEPKRKRKRTHDNTGKTCSSSNYPGTSRQTATTHEEGSIGCDEGKDPMPGEDLVTSAPKKRTLLEFSST
jgi:hypothetical protein